MKKWQRLLLILGIVFSCLLCIANIVLAVIFPSNGANVFTAISGWVSGIATLLVGMIAYAQSRHYSLITMKSEQKERIRAEQEKVVEISNYTAQWYSQIKKPLSILVQNNVTQNDLLSYDVEINNIQEQLLIASHKVQLLLYTPNTVVALASNMIELIKRTHNSFSSAKQHYANDALLGGDIKKLSEYVSSWTTNNIELCQKAMQELFDFSKAIDDAHSIAELKIVLHNVEQKTMEALKEVAKLIDAEKNNIQVQS